jgi:transposase
MKQKKFKLEDFDFEDLYRKEQNPVKKVRLLGLQLLKEGKSKTEIGKVLKKHRHSIGFWLKRFFFEGLDGLIDKQRSGRTPILPREKEEEFLTTLDDLHSSNNGGRTTAGDIKNLLKQKFKVEYSIDGVYDLLDRLNIVWITGRSIHPKADKEKQEEFKKKLSRVTKKMSSQTCKTK